MDTSDRPHARWAVTRRDFLVASGAACAALATPRADASDTAARFGLVSDCHYADREPAGVRHYRHSLDKLAECVELMNERQVDFLVELGDFKDQDSPPDEARTLDYLRRIEAVFRRYQGPRYHVLGNHDMDSISKDRFMAEIENTGVPPDRTFYSFDGNGVRAVVLDANFRSDGTAYDRGNFDWTDAHIPAGQLEWLEEELARAEGPAVVFIHQRLDGRGDLFVGNAEDTRRILERSGKVLAVFQGHHHAGDHVRLNGIHYYTLMAVVDGAGPDSNAYAVVDVHASGDMVVTGYRKAAGHTDLPRHLV